MTKLETIARSETAVKRTKVHGQTVMAARTVKRSAEDDTRFVIAPTFNFDGVSKEDLMLLAARSLVIDVQGRFRKADATKFNDTEVWNRTWDVQKEFVERARKEANVVDAAEKLMATMSAEEKAELLARLREEA